MSSASFRHLLSPILRRWCTSSSSSSTTSCANKSERYELNSGSRRHHRDKVTKCDVTHNDVTHNDVNSESDDSATTKTKENEFTDIQVGEFLSYFERIENNVIRISKFPFQKK